MDDHNYKLSELIETFSKYNETHNIEDAHQSLNNAKTNTETLKQRAVTELAATNAKMTQLEIKISGLQSALATANTQIATLTANITTLKTEKSSLETHLTSRQADISKLNADLTAAQGSLASLEAQLKTPNTSDTSELEKSIQAKQKVINDLNAALVAADQTKSSINKELDDVKKTLADTTTQYSDAMTNIQTLENKSATAKQEKTTMQAKIDDLTALIQKHADEERVRNVAESEDKARRIGQQKKSREEHQRELDQFKQEAVDAADRATKLTEYVKRLESDKQHLELERAPTNSAALLALYKNAKAKEEQQQQPAKPADPKKIKPRAN
jgi:chromosome segregation ATPase